MIPVFNFDEIRNIEKRIISEDKFPSLILMENAGRGFFDELSCLVDDFLEFDIYIICGKGNNAGDGYTIARHMAINEIPLKVINLSERNELSGDALTNLDILMNIRSDYVEFENINELNNWYNLFKDIKRSKRSLIIDAILGTGIKGKLSEKLTAVINDINSIKRNANNLIISVDVPSGLSSDNKNDIIIQADYTLTMQSIKEELLFHNGYEFSGEIIPVHIGITEEYFRRYGKSSKFLIEEKDIKNLLPKRKRASYKYVNGKVLVIGGSPGLSGALAMASLSAMKSGSGGVAAAFPSSIQPVFNRGNHEIMKLILPSADDGSIKKDSFDKLKGRLKWADSVLIGPGISVTDDTTDFVFEFINKNEKDIVIDADGLNIISKNLNIIKDRPSGNNLILTPHIGEFSKLSGFTSEEIINNRFDTLQEFSNKYNVDVILKSERTISCIKKENINFYINTTGNEALAVAGTGDVLSGIIVSMLSQSKNPESACIIANYIHGKCADLYYEKYGNKQTATPNDIIKLIPSAISEILY